MFSRLVITLLAALLTVASPVPAPVGPRDLIDEITHLITEIDVFIGLDSFITNNVTVNLNVQNPLIFPLKVNSIQSTASLNGTTLATISHSFENFVTPPLGKASSGNITQVPLTQGITASLNFVPAGILNVQAIINLDIGVLPVPIFPYAQQSVPTVYSLDV